MEGTFTFLEVQNGFIGPRTSSTTLCFLQWLVGLDFNGELILTGFFYGGVLSHFSISLFFLCELIYNGLAGVHGSGQEKPRLIHANEMILKYSCGS